jgi:hypothetical protein
MLTGLSSVEKFMHVDKFIQCGEVYPALTGLSSVEKFMHVDRFMPC